MTLSKERLVEITSGDSSRLITVSEALAMARELLERRERDKQEPVAWQFKSVNGDWLSVGKAGMEQAVREGCEVRSLYAAPPAPVAPDLKELEAILDWILMLPCPTPKATHFAKRLAVVIDTCRAAMLNGGQP